MADITLATIGFTQSSAEHFFGRLREAEVATVVDVRLRTGSQLAGFAKARDLAYFLRAIGGIGYRHEPLLAPEPEMLDAYRKKVERWDAYADRYLALIAARRVEERLRPEDFDRACLLCSEAAAHHCHRRLAAEYLRDRWAVPVDVNHL
ncbi:hypothetical protein C882_0691 [Caenispirillum salinarum AK4]|uniref:DUF488 domain-containing protein n=1 Tax=Caenispirillum salinarum AK4 TaxID=1238182 RepID=K9GUN4_9PROT|nr:DUF488 domain-containing protein [Caenispirillum salinarum]EKV28927.1 hypothetical protein C882_0691 [Caenispirillum salinarum AK4]